MGRQPTWAGRWAKRRGREDGQPALEAVCAVLERQGYEPRLGGVEITLANCPLHALPQDYTDLICGMNLDILQVLLAGLSGGGLEAVLEPSPDRCCVVVRGTKPGS